MKAMPRLSRLLAVGALALGLIAVVPGTALAVPTPPGGTNWAELYNPIAGTANDGFPVCLDVPSGSRSTGLGIQMYHCHGYAGNGGPQRWTFVHVSDGSYEIFNQANGLCLTPRPGTDPINFDVQIVQEPCGRYAGQEWFMVDVLLQPDHFYLRNDTYPNKCLWASGGAHRNNSYVELVTCDNEALEIWALG